MFLEDMDKPRGKKYADAPGAYQLATRVEHNVIDPGEVLNIEQFITGYGNIAQAKIYCLISSQLFDKERSHIKTGLQPNDDPEHPAPLRWGRDEHKPDDMFVLALSGVRKEGWDESTIFFDAPFPGNQIITERDLKGPPFEYSFKTHKHLKPGDHYIDFYLTYFNGEKWVSTKERISFKARNFFERHSKAFTSLAIIASICAILRFTGEPLATFLMDYAHQILRIKAG